MVLLTTVDFDIRRDRASCEIFFMGNIGSFVPIAIGLLAGSWCGSGPDLFPGIILILLLQMILRLSLLIHTVSMIVATGEEKQEVGND